MIKNWNRISQALLECFDENEKMLEVECKILSPNFIKYLDSLTTEMLLTYLNENKEFYFEIERYERYDVICSGDLESECETIFVDTIEDRLKKLLGKDTRGLFTHNQFQLNAFVEFDEDKSHVVINDFETAEKFNKIKTVYSRKKKIASILK